VFDYTIQAGDTDADGISINANSIQTNSGSIEDAGGNTASLTHASVADDGAFLVDTTAPTVSSIVLSDATGDQNSTLNAGDTFSVTVTMSEAVVVDTGGGTPRVAASASTPTRFRPTAAASRMPAATPPTSRTPLSAITARISSTPRRRTYPPVHRMTTPPTFRQVTTLC
jgi:hypothetical protein